MNNISFNIEPEYIILVYGNMHAVRIKREDINKYSEEELDLLMKKQILEFLNGK